MNIVVLDGYAANPGDLSYDKLMALGTVTVYPRTTDEEKVERAREADIILINKVNIDAATMDQLPRLKYIGVQATGYNVVDIEAAHQRGITVCNVPAYSTASVAQHTLALILNITNHVDHYARQSRNMRWSYNQDFCYWNTPLTELAGLRLGILGLGNIGMRVARIARELGMDIYASTSKPPTALPAWITKVSREGLLAVSDILTLHCPLTTDTCHIINDDTLRQMRPGAIIINTARGALVDEHAVARALHEGHLAAYAADVMEQEPPSPDNPLFKEPNAYLTPHNAWATLAARQRLFGVVADNVEAFIKGNPINVV